MTDLNPPVPPVPATTLTGDVISESTDAAGVTVDGVLLKDSDVEAAEVRTDVVSEKTAAAGVTIDGVLVKDGTVDGADISTHDHSGEDGTGQVDHVSLKNVGSNTHVQIDTALSKVWQVQLSDGTSQSTTNATTWISVVNESVAANAMGANGMVTAHIAGRYNNNSGVAKVIELRVSFGGTVIYRDAASITADASDRGWQVWVKLYNKNSASAQSAAIFFSVGRAGAATTGVGNLDQGPEKGGALRSIDSTKDTTSAQTLLVEVRQQTTAAGVVLEKDHASMEVFQAA